MQSPISAHTVTNRDDETDVLIIGSGLAGVCAAIEARNAGADVLMIDRASGPGGTSATSSGLFYMGGGTALQQACGIEDSVEDLYRFLTASCGVPDAGLLRAFADGSPAHFDWLEQQGVPFERSYYKDKHMCPPTTEGLVSTGSEKIWPFNAIAAPASRGHRVAHPGDAAGSLAMTILQSRAEALGVRMAYDVRITALVTDEDGSVVGAQGASFGKDRTFGCRGGVVIATGGFQHNRELIARHAPDMLGESEAIGIPYNDGSGILLGQSAGAAVSAMDAVMVTACFYPPSQLIKGIIVNNLGERFVAEDSYHGRTASFVRDQPGSIAYLIVDAEIFAYPELHEAFNIQLIDGWETVAEMEAGLGLPHRSLCKTMADYNAAAERGADPQFQKQPQWLKPLSSGPYAAFDISFNHARHNYMTLGGLRITAQGEVMSTQGRAIAGLYAAGACTANIVQDAKGYASGMTLAPASFFGRMAGRAAADRGRAATVSAG